MIAVLERPAAADEPEGCPNQNRPEDELVSAAEARELERMVGDGESPGAGSRRVEFEGEVDAESDGEAGLATAEYAIATIAAVGFGALLITVLKSNMVQHLLEQIFTKALTSF